ncbi:hypothetical protein BV378_18735 [Nostoc sp. RF31YmG]|jgi:hypothetical protein|nr:hypothetical protein BV378_18735 [Nostoc sp. RF31YmG]
MNTVSGYAITEKNGGVVAECEVSNCTDFLQYVTKGILFTNDVVQEKILYYSHSYVCYNYSILILFLKYI